MSVLSFLLFNRLENLNVTMLFNFASCTLSNYFNAHTKYDQHYNLDLMNKAKEYGLNLQFFIQMIFP